METIYWFIIFLVLVLFEIITLGLTTIWFAIGAIVAFIASVAGLSLILQVILFFSVSILSLAFTRPLAKRYINDRAVRTNADSIIGKYGKVTEEIDNINATGYIMIEGNTWMARSENDTIIKEGTIVKITAIEGAKVIVVEE